MSAVQGRISEEKKTKERLAFTLYNILSEFDPSKKGYLSLARFYKVAYLIHKDLERQSDLNTGLPWYWYLYGPVVALNYCPTEVYSTVSFGENEQRIFSKNRPETRFLTEEEKRTIVGTIRKWRDLHLQTSDAIDKAYASVEIGFLREIKRLEDDLKLLQLDPDQLMISTDSIKGQLDKLIQDYPEDCFEDLLPPFLRVDNILRVASDMGIKQVRKYLDLLSNFRKIFVTKASTVLWENLPVLWVRNQNEAYLREKRFLDEDLDEVERNVFSAEYSPSEDRTGYKRILMEISWGMFKEE